MFESGPHGLTATLRREGFRAVVVGKDGHAYDVPRWPSSGTFRLGDQRNLLLTDNQTRAFDAMSRESQATHAYITWGDYLEPVPDGFPALGIGFPKGSLDPTGYPG
jgi:hypothetical protein